jgi:hypothetical protein
MEKHYRRQPARPEPAFVERTHMDGNPRYYGREDRPYKSKKRKATDYDDEETSDEGILRNPRV